METKINIAEILKNVPMGTKLYSPLFGNVYLIYAGEIFITVRHHSTTANFYHNGRLYNYEGTEPMLFPSREIRDWSKFTWKKGDVLVSNDGSTEVIFDRWYDDTYTSFYGKHYLDSENENNIKYFEGFVCTTERYFLEDKDVAQTYINTIEERLDGKLNRETLEIEKTQPEFMDGDILSCDEDSYTKHTTLIFHKNGDKRESIVSLIRHKELVEANEYINDFLLSRLNYASEDEKKELFNALAKKGKAWDAEKKQIVDLKPKVELKTFDKVLVRNDKEDQWSANIFSYQVKDIYYCLGESYWRYCIPYIGNEHLLGTTKDVEG